MYFIILLLYLYQSIFHQLIYINIFTPQLLILLLNYQLPSGSFLADPPLQSLCFLLSPDSSLLVDNYSYFMLFRFLPDISFVGDNETDLLLFVLFPLGYLYFEYSGYLLLFGFLPVGMFQGQS